MRSKTAAALSLYKKNNGITGALLRFPGLPPMMRREKIADFVTVRMVASGMGPGEGE